MNNLLIITGAGASHDVINVNTFSKQVNFENKSPLTKDLFNPNFSNLISGLLTQYPLAAQISHKFLNINKNGITEKGLEDYLSEIKNSENKMLSKQYWSIPFYLEELFGKVSNHYIKSSIQGVPSNYYELICAVEGSRYEKIIWINLNYDLLADHALEIATGKRLEVKNDYLNLKTKSQKKIKYIKPHGSINWYREYKSKGIDSDAIIYKDSIKKGIVRDDFEQLLSEEIYTIQEVNHWERPHATYPAISVPIGDYDFVCKEHKESIIPDLKETTTMLCIGFNALDKDVLDLIKYNVPKITKLKIVSKNLTESEEVYKRIKGYFYRGPLTYLPIGEVKCNGGFSQFVVDDLQRWLSF